MSFRSIVRDVRDSFGNISRRGYGVFLSGYSRSKSSGSTRDMYDKSSLLSYSCWANLPQELLVDIIQRMEESESTWPSRKNVLACAAVCRTWREMCKEIIKCPELSGKITFLVSLKQPGARNGNIKCFIRRDEANSIYSLYLCLSNDLHSEAGKFLLSSKRIRRTTCTEYIISTDATNISRSNKSYVGSLKSNFLATKFFIYDTQPPYNETGISGSCQRRHRFYSKKVSPRPRIPSGSYNTAQITYELNVLGTRCPRRMNCIMHSIPASSLASGGSVACLHPKDLYSHSKLEDSFRRSVSLSKSSIMDHSMDFSSCRFSDNRETSTGEDNEDEVETKMKNRPLVLRNKSPRWHEQLECWCLNFRGRVTVASVKNFQLVASTQSLAGPPTPQAPPDHDKIILQFGKIGRDRFTMDYRYPLSAFQAFAICLSSFDTKIACE